MTDDYEDDFDSSRSPPSEAMKFEVRLTEYNMNGIAQDIAQQMAERAMRDHGGAIQKLAKEIMTDRINKQLEDAIRPIVDAALDQPMVPTDAFGKPKGEPVTAKDMIAAGTAEFLQMNVNHEGKAAKPDSWSSQNSTRLSWLLRDLIDKKFASEIDTSVRKMKADIQKQMQEAAAVWLADFQAKAKSAFEKAK